MHTFLTASPDVGLYPVSLIRGRDKNLYGTHTVTYKAADAQNPSISTIVQATVVVPHDMSNKTN